MFKHFQECFDLKDIKIFIIVLKKFFCWIITLKTFQFIEKKNSPHFFNHPELIVNILFLH